MKPEKLHHKKAVKAVAKAPGARRTIATPSKAALAPKAATSQTVGKRTPRKATLEIPPLLLEGDAPPPAPVAGPGQRYALGPTPPAEHFVDIGDLGELPEAYGTKQLLLAARDPHWLYVQWDFTREQQKKCNALSADRHLVLRVYIDAVTGQPFVEIHAHPESRHWFVPVGRAGTKYVATLGYYESSGAWVTVSTSGATLTPPDAMSTDTSVQFATLPVDVPFAQLLQLVKAVMHEHIPLSEVVAQLQARGY